jgi:hypothetical protein
VTTSALQQLCVSACAARTPRTGATKAVSVLRQSELHGSGAASLVSSIDRQHGSGAASHTCIGTSAGSTGTKEVRVVCLVFITTEVLVLRMGRKARRQLIPVL